MMLDTILSKCDERYQNHKCGECPDCSYGDYCPNDCEKCLHYIHFPNKAPIGASNRKYDCKHMADFYTCRFSCKYASEIVYAVEHMRDLKGLKNLKVLSFGCGPCTDLFAIDFLKEKGTLEYEHLEYRGIDYSQDVWSEIHGDIKNFENENFKIDFMYQDACDIIKAIKNDDWLPNLIVFQYVFSDMKKHTSDDKINVLIEDFADYYNNYVPYQTYVVLNDINLDVSRGGGREYFDRLLLKLNGATCKKGRFRNPNPNNPSCPNGYRYGEEFPCNKIHFDMTKWMRYLPSDNICTSAQMIIKKEVSK